ncbi:MAG: serine hydrolase [Saprospiraceae bacterium]|nr:serine hydrolase [Saprospiraceae bacterium]MCC6843346.1 serine hydrolase [Saprospiraceae bacterium]
MGQQIKMGLLIFISSTLLTSCQLGRYVFYNFADIKDHKKFQSRPLSAANSPFNFQVTNNGKFPKELNNIPFDKYLEDNKTVAFLIIKNDTIQYEKYFEGYDRESIVPSFSMAKSVTSILIGCAIDERLIKSVDEPIINYIPELSKNGFNKVTIKHLLQMTSGIKFNESYVNPVGDAASFYYGLNLRKEIEKMKLKTEPGKQFEYVSGNTQLLGLVLERSLKNKTITQYLQEKIWTPLEMEYDASWSIDRKNNGLEKTFCCLNARARDFAKIGRLYKNKGNWNGKQIVSQKWVEESTKLDTSEGSAKFYQYQWWLPTPNEDFMAEGILGQFLYVNPKKDLIIVRLGMKEGKAYWWTIFTSLAKAY